VSAAALIGAWDQAASAPVLARAPRLLQALGVLGADRDVDELSVGLCDAHVYAAARALGLESLELACECPECAEELELEVPLAALAPDAQQPRPTSLRIEAHDHALRLRPLCERDLIALSQLGAAVGARDVAARCVSEARDRDGRELALDELPPAVVEAVLCAAADSDPGAEVAVAVRCACGAGWEAEVDIRRFVWEEVAETVARAMGDVHALACAYGWSEPEILALSEERRRWYVTAVAA
jgi:hypothetical protein